MKTDNAPIIPPIRTCALPLYKRQADGGFEESKVFYCSNCGHVGTKEMIDNDKCLFCVPDAQRYPKSPCVRCEKVLVRHAKYCDTCSIEQRLESGALTLITEEQLPAIALPLNHDDDYYEDMYDLMDRVNDQVSGDEENWWLKRPKYAHVCEEETYRLDADRIIESALDDSFEDAVSHISNEAVKTLQAILDMFVEENPVKWFYPNNKEVVLIPWEKFDTDSVIYDQSAQGFICDRSNVDTAPLLTPGIYVELIPPPNYEEETLGQK